jgi:hypothetical protein
MRRGLRVVLAAAVVGGQVAILRLAVQEIRLAHLRHRGTTAAREPLPVGIRLAVAVAQMRLVVLAALKAAARHLAPAARG